MPTRSASELYLPTSTIEPEHRRARRRSKVCYPSAGYGLVDGGEIISVPTTGGMPAGFLGLVFAKKGGMGDREEVYYSFRHEGQWTPGVEGNWRALRYSPAAFKIQVQRKVT